MPPSSPPLPYDADPPYASAGHGSAMPGKITGIHSFGWSRERALGFMTEHGPMPPEFLAAEIDRYVVMPGQALAYLTGQLEMLRIREDARQRLGPAFSLPAFHGAILDHGSLSMPTPGPQHRQLAGSGR